VLVGALIAGGIALGFMPSLAPSAGVTALAILAVVVAASGAIVNSMVFGLLATEVPAERRSQTLNLVYLPLYAAGIIGIASGHRQRGPSSSLRGRPTRRVRSRAWRTAGIRSATRTTRLSRCGSTRADAAARGLPRPWSPTRTRGSGRGRADVQ